MHLLEIFKTPVNFRHLVLVILSFMQIFDFHTTQSLRLSQPKCPFGNYFTDGCVSCWCDPGNGQRVCENMISCPRKNIKCPMGSKYQDECSNDCTCYENTGAIFCKEKGSCNSIKRRNTYQAPKSQSSSSIALPLPYPPLPPTPNINRMDINVQEREKITSEMVAHVNAHHQQENEHQHQQDSFHIPNSVPIHKEDLIIEPALIIRRKSFKGNKEEDKKKKHPTTLLYLYEKQLKSMKDFKNYYKHYLDSQNSSEHGKIGKDKVKNLQKMIDPFSPSSTNMKPNFTPNKSKSTSSNLLTLEEIINPNNLPRGNELEIQIPLRNFKIASTSSRPPQDFHYIFRNMKENGHSKFHTSTMQSIPMSNFTPNSYKPVQKVSPTLSVELPKKTPSKNSAIATIYNVYSTTSRPVEDLIFISSTTKRPQVHDFYSNNFTSASPRPQYLSYNTRKPTMASTNSSQFYVKQYHQIYSTTTTTTPKPQRSHTKDQNVEASGSGTHHHIHAELNKPIFVNHIVASRRYPEIYGPNANIYSEPEPPTYTHRPNKYRLFLKSADKRPLFYSDRNRVPLFVDKIAREFFRKPAIFVPKIKHVRGKPELELNRVVYNHKEMIPKELVLEPGGPPMKIKFTPEAEREMNQEWMDALHERDEINKMEQSLGYQYNNGNNGNGQSYHNAYHQHHYDHPHYTQQSQSQQQEQITQNNIHALFSSPQPNYNSNNNNGVSFIQEMVPSVNDHEMIQLPMPHPIPMPYPENVPNYSEYSDSSFSSSSFRPGPPYQDHQEQIVHHYPSSSPLPEIPSISMTQDYSIPVIEHPIPDYDSYKPPPSTVTESENNYSPPDVSPRPEISHSTFQIPSDSMDDFRFGFGMNSYGDIWSGGGSGGHKNQDSITSTATEQGTMIIDMIKQAEEITQTTNKILDEKYEESHPRPRISIQDVLAHKQSQSGQKQQKKTRHRSRNHIRIKPDLDPSFTLPTAKPRATSTTTTPSPQLSSTTEEFNAEKILREILSLDPDIGPDAVLYNEDGETIPPLSSFISTSTSTPIPPSATATNVPFIKSKGDVGLLPQNFDPQPPIWSSNPDRSSFSTTTTTTTTVDPLSFEQFYQDLFRPQTQKKRQDDDTKPDGVVNTDGVAKIFRYDSIIKNFKSGSSSEEEDNSRYDSIESRNMDKRDHKNSKSKKNNSSKRTSSQKKKNAKNDETKKIFLTTSTTTEKPKIIPEPKFSPEKDKNDANASFKRELDWKSNLMADICKVNPNSALCFTYKSLCMLMSS